MGKKAPQAPPAPDPVALANAQSASNIATAQEQQRLNLIGTQGPTGTTGYRADPTQPGGYTQYTNLSPQEQASYDLTKQAENSALGVAGQQIGRVGNALGQPLNLEGLPELQGQVSGGTPIQYGFDPGQQVQGQVGGDLEAARLAATNAVYNQATSRLDPQWQQREDSERVRLANQGLGENSTAYQTAIANQGRERTDAYNQAAYSSIGAGEDAANALFGRQMGQGQFANQAAAQMYGQNQGSAAFNNAATGQEFGQNLQNAQLQNTARQQGLQERAYIQNQPLNQFNSLMSSSQVGMPQGVQYTPSQVANTDVIGANALSVQAQQAAANRAAQQKSGLMSGLFSLGSAALMASDIRLKTDIRKLRTRKDGIGVYAYRYRSGGPERIGVMAQEVLRVRPEAVVTMADGYMAVNYGAL